MAGKLSAQDRLDLEKYTKFLAIKATQIIVQSRLGDKVSTKCKPHSSGTDWFNLAIPDLPEVSTQARNVMGGQLPSSRLPLCVEISLKTTEGDCMVLETWLLSFLEPTDHVARVTHTVYNRMGLLLKSLIAVTRVTPAYKLSRRQGPDSYLICYRIYSGEPQLHLLGEGQSQVRVGQLSTPLGTLQLSVAYRTKMTISPQHTTSQARDIMVKSDHFHPDLSPRHHNRFLSTDDSNTSLSDTIKAGAFADPGHKPSVPLLLSEDKEVPFSSLLTPVCRTSPPNSPTPSVEQDNNNRNNAATEAASQQQTQDNKDNNNANFRPSVSPPNSRRSSCSGLSSADDFIMVDLKTPFAGGNANSDLGAFYRECQTAPPLRTFSEQPSLAEQVSALPSQLEIFEQHQAEYDALLSSLISQPSLT